LAEQAADHRAQNKTQAEGGAGQAEIGGAFFRRRDVGDIGVDGGIGAAGHARQGAADEQPGDGGGKAGDGVIQAQHQQRQDQDRPPPEPVRQIADQGRTQKLHGGIDEEQPAAPARRAGQRLMGQFRDDAGRYRNDQPQADRVDQHGHEDEEECEAAGIHQTDFAMSRSLNF
jgi:hypothetical protein